ncbi:MAG: DUF2441 domain-containing protein [Eubacteriales bacterium]
MNVYHVVTERPMHKGQLIIFDAQHHNGVYHRVTAFEQILKGERVTEPLHSLISADMDKWAKVAYRELALEQIRQQEYSQYPSRMACLYTSNSLDEAYNWANFFQDIGRDVFSIVKLNVEGTIFTGDARNCFDGVGDNQIDFIKARNYWALNTLTDNPVLETLVAGKITVDEIVITYK